MGQVIGIDSAVFIYLLERNAQYLSRARSVLGLVRDGEVRAIFSCVGLIEVLTGPKRHDRYDLAAQYWEQITSFPNLTVIGINEHIVDLASDLRARYGIATPDAIHIATAIDAGASAFVTNDKSLKKAREIKIKLL